MEYGKLLLAFVLSVTTLAAHEATPVSGIVGSCDGSGRNALRVESRYVGHSLEELKAIRKTLVDIRASQNLTLIKKTLNFIGATVKETCLDLTSVAAAVVGITGALLAANKITKEQIQTAVTGVPTLFSGWQNFKANITGNSVDNAIIVGGLALIPVALLIRYLLTPNEKQDKANVEEMKRLLPQLDQVIDHIDFEIQKLEFVKIA
ncbi:MAG: hypothetical protein WCT20_01760 [Candidatus Babeliales bacterium]